MARVRTVLREERFTFLLTVDEREAIDTAAAEVGLDRSAYVRSVLFGWMQPIGAQRHGGPAPRNAAGDPSS